MKCPKCSYTSFDYLQECKKCGENLDGSRKALNLKMGAPTIFANIDNRDENPDNLDKPTTETTFIETQDEQPENDLLLSNEFSAPATSDNAPSPEVDLNLENELELGGLGNMNNIKPRSESNFAADPPENIVLDEIELSPTFSGNTAPESNFVRDESTSFAAGGLDLFAEPADTEIAQADQLENDIAFELSMNDSEIDLGLTETPISAPETPQNYGTIELELDMDDDESLDDLLADLEKKN